jgi:glycerol-3-phosphate dehydrogenase
VYDLLVIGGGIVGAGAARDAAMRGLKVALVEQTDLAFGTSSRSSKLVHGGLRYLEQGEFSLVFEAVSERRVLMEIAPHLVQPLGFLFPVYKGSRRGVFTLNVGMWLYDGLSLFRSPKMHRNLSAKQAIAEEPALNAKDLKGAPLYYDCQTDDARLTIENALDARGHGADIFTYTRVVGLLKDAQDRVRGARVHDRLSGEEREIPARVVLNATGPWTDGVRALGSAKKPLLRPTKGVHIVVDHARLPVTNAVVCFHPQDGRVLFAIPWGDRTYLGTTDTDWQGDPGEVAADAADVRYLIDAGNSYFPGAALEEDDVIATWAGLRPLISGEGTASSVSREHEIIVDSDGLITIAGGKLTTYRKMAKELVDAGVALIRIVAGPDFAPGDAHTAREPLPGGRDWPDGDDDLKQVAARIREAAPDAAEPMDDATAILFGQTYGTVGVEVAARMTKDPTASQRLVPGRAERMAQVDHAVENELARTVSDVMVRRTQLHFRDVEQGLGALEAVADRMAGLLGWSDARRTEEVLAYEQEVARTRAWRAERGA